jgi:hypothetical protein
MFSNPDAPAYARMTGALYLIIAVAGGFSIAYVPSQLHVPGDAGATVARIIANRGLFNLGVGGDVVMMLAELMITAMLFMMFRRVNPTLSLIACFARLRMVAVMAAMLLFNAGALALADPGGALGSFTAQQRADLAGLMLQIHDAGVWIWQLFFALHLALLGGLAARSGRCPAWLGHGMTLGAMGYALDSLHAFAMPDAATLGHVRIALLAIVTLAELGFAFWLLVRGPAGQMNLKPNSSLTPDSTKVGIAAMKAQATSTLSGSAAVPST